HVLVRHDTSCYHDDIIGTFPPEFSKNLRKYGHLDAGQEAHTEHVDIFLDGGGHDFIGRPMKARVDDVHAGVAQRPRNNFDAAIVAVEPNLGEEHADRHIHWVPPTTTLFGLFGLGIAPSPNLKNRAEAANVNAGYFAAESVWLLLPTARAAPSDHSKRA